jgi:hypothetical protein
MSPQAAPRPSQLVVFIAWAGARGQRIAATLREFLPSVNQHLAPWHDHRDVLPGEDWRNEVLLKIARADCMVLCITEDAMTSPWMPYEAGFFAGHARGSGERPLYTMMCGPSRSEMPGTHPLYPVLKSVSVDEAGWLDLCLMLRVLAEQRGIGGREMTEERTKKNFRAHWPEAERALSVQDEVIKAATSDHDLLRQLIHRVEALQASVDELKGQRRSVAWIDSDPRFEGVEQADDANG